MEIFDLANINCDRYVSVIVDCIGIEDLLTYRIPEDINIQIGDILSVPLGNRHVGAIALQISDTSAIANLDTEIKSVSAVVSSGIFPRAYWEMLIRTADYYRTPVMQTVKTALPPKLLDQSHYRIKVKQTLPPPPPLPEREGEPDSFSPLPEGEGDSFSPLPLGEGLGVRAIPKAAQMVWDFLQEHKNNPKGISRRYIQQKLGRYTSSGLKELQKLEWIDTFLELPNRPQPKYEDVVILLKIPDSEVTTRQAEILTILQHQGGECLKTQLCKIAKTSVSVIQTLANKGYITISKQESLRLGGKSHTVTRDRNKDLTPDQDAALQQILKAFTDQAAPHFLLHGVTGSGKTEVYLQAIAAVLTAGKSALVLVPEIGLTPQLTDRFRARFGDARVNVYHSQLSEGERFDTWRLMLTGEAQIVIGTRSAVFAPLSNLGLIVMDEEHDNSFKQDQPQPCYHARTIAEWRSQLENIPLVLGSATPSAEVIYAHQEGKSIYLELP
ncbi:MAG: DEAD/DEAH box helicase, partial [Pseudanabaena sp.]